MVYASLKCSCVILVFIRNEACCWSRSYSSFRIGMCIVNYYNVIGTDGCLHWHEWCVIFLIIFLPFRKSLLALAQLCSPSLVLHELSHMKVIWFNQFKSILLSKKSTPADSTLYCREVFQAVSSKSIIKSTSKFWKTHSEFAPETSHRWRYPLISVILTPTVGLETNEH